MLGRCRIAYSVGEGQTFDMIGYLCGDIPTYVFAASKSDEIPCSVWKSEDNFKSQQERHMLARVLRDICSTNLNDCQQDFLLISEGGRDRPLTRSVDRATKFSLDLSKKLPVARRLGIFSHL